MWPLPLPTGAGPMCVLGTFSSPYCYLLLLCSFIAHFVPFYLTPPGLAPSYFSFLTLTHCFLSSPSVLQFPNLFLLPLLWSTCSMPLLISSNLPSSFLTFSSHSYLLNIYNLSLILLPLSLCSVPIPTQEEVYEDFLGWRLGKTNQT
jgi:hypothetical protein